MTTSDWSKSFENTLKAPPIGTPEWFACIAPVQREVARQLVTNHVPVVLQQQDSDGPSFLVLFDGTEFIAGGFDDRSTASSFAATWNRNSIPLA